jgi:hypothetical protein
MFNKKGIKAKHIDGKSKDRQKILKDFSDNKFQILCNSSLLLEGYDEPSIDCVINLRATKIQSLYSQILGRGTRICEGKKDLLVLEYDWRSSRHEVANAFNLMEEDDVLSNLAMSVVSSSPGKVYDVLDVVETAKTDIGGLIFGKMYKHVKQQLARYDKLLDYKAFAFLRGDYRIMTYQPTFAWERKEITRKQAECFYNRGIDPKGLDRGLASMILDILFNPDHSYGTVKQIRVIAKQMVEPGVGTISFSEASNIIDEMVQNQWVLKDSAKKFINTRIEQNRHSIYRFCKENVENIDF